MRLTCPNCKAQYEVDDSVIPDAGRDVQCSACGHTWYQYPASVALRMRAEDIDDEDESDDTPAATPAPGGAQTLPRIDRTVLDVLREEAEREIGERRRRGASLETQGDLALTAPRPRRVEPEARDEPEDEQRTRAASRRNLLPDIEELSSTLEPGSEPRRKSGDAALPPGAVQERRSFRRGLAVVFLIGIAFVAVYLLAPVIAAQVPALAEPLAAYVALVDGARADLARLLRDLLGRLG